MQIVAEVENEAFPKAQIFLEEINPEVIKEAIYASGGVLTRSAALLNIPRDVLYKIIEEDEDLKVYLTYVRETRNDARLDLYEDVAHNKALLGDTTMLWKLMCTYGAKRGYGDKQQLEVSYDIPPHVREIITGLQGARSLESKPEAG